MILQERLRRQFKANNKQDQEVYRQFLTNNAWGANGCPFELEFPYTTIPGMINDKLVRHFLKVKVSF